VQRVVQLEDSKKESEMENPHINSVNYWLDKVMQRQEEHEEWMDSIEDCVDDLNYKILEIREDLRLVKKVLNNVLR
jgi:peptidoglycan hydrolase CwlO-like protein